MKAQTIDQYYILKEIEKHFDMDFICLELLASNSIAVKDGKDSIIFTRHNDGLIRTGQEIMAKTPPRNKKSPLTRALKNL